MAGPDMRHLSIRAMMALTLKHFGSPASLEFLMVFANGQLTQWPGWRYLPFEEQRTISRLLFLRPDAMADRWLMQNIARAELNRSEIFAPAPDDIDSFIQVAGKGLDQIIEEAMEGLADKKKQTAHVRDSIPGDDGMVRLSSSKAEYVIPMGDIDSDTGPYMLDPPKEFPDVEVPISALLDLARDIDTRAHPPFSYEQVLTAFLNELHDGKTHSLVSRTIRLTSGLLDLCIAPTGGGKSVLIHVLALLLAKKGIPVSIVLPQIKDVVEKSFIFEQHIQSLGLMMTVASLNSPNSLFDKTAEFLDRPLDEDKDSKWVLNHFGYFCRLRAYYVDGPAEGDFEPGKEPCKRVFCQEEGKRRPKRMNCPFLGTCPKFKTFTKALHADILVINHSAFIQGRIALPMVDHRKEPVSTSIQLLMNRSPIVLIDEIDAFQDKAVQMGAKGLELSGSGHFPPLTDLTREFQEKLIREQAPLPSSISLARTSLLLIENASCQLTDMIDRQEIDWQKNVRKICYSRTFDRDIADALWQDHSQDRIEQLNALVCPRTPGGSSAPPDSKEYALYAEALRWLTPLPAALPSTSRLKSDLVATLQTEFGISQPHVTQVADRLIIKILLHIMESKLSHLRSILPQFEAYDITKAAEVQDRLQGYMPWLASPLGPLQKRVWGFQVTGEDQKKHTLTAHCIAGDPHNYVLGLGQEFALALAGKKRCVVGFSATAKFHGSTIADIQAPLSLYQRDDDQKVNIYEVVVHDKDSPVRISGVADPSKRLREARKMAAGMWDQFLKMHIESLHKNKPERSKVLLITGSYREAFTVGTTLQQMIDQSSSKRYGVYTVARDREGSDSRMIKPFQIESFPDYPDGDILVAPLEVIARGYNIIQAGSTESALASIFILVRPVPPIGDTKATSAYVSYRNQLLLPTRDVCANLKTAHSHALSSLRNIQSHCTLFSRLPKGQRFHIYCNILVKIIQLAGRARRGGTSVDLYLVDSAFAHERVGWKQLTAQALDSWRKQGKTDQMNLLYGGLIKSLQSYAASS